MSTQARAVGVSGQVRGDRAQEVREGGGEPVSRCGEHWRVDLVFFECLHLFIKMQTMAVEFELSGRNIVRI